MIVADSSAWIELLRRSGSPAHQTLRRLLDEGMPLATTEMVVGELLAGARDDLHHARLRRELLATRFVPLGGLDGFQHAARLVRKCRSRGFTASLTDCLVAAPAIAAGATMLHADGDFDRIASATALEVYPLDPA
ncbi:MAG: PIN domain-containing protein [Thermoleophilaceae bacterium]|nr:PIN domain-containing protein [Thermoleophilaceae bacterium]